MEPQVQKLMIKFKLDVSDINKLLGAGLTTPKLIRKAALDKKIPAGMSTGTKTRLETKFAKKV